MITRRGIVVLVAWLAALACFILAAKLHPAKARDLDGQYATQNRCFLPGADA